MKPRPRRILSRLTGLCAIALLAMPALTSSAAFLTVTVDLAPPNANLTTEGAFDWAIYDNTGGATASISPTNTKSGSSVLNTAALTAVTVGNSVRGTSSKGAELFTYTNGTSPTSQTNATVAEVFDSTLDLVGTGVKFSVAGDPLVTRTLKVWATGFNGQGTLTATLPGAANQLALSQLYTASKVPTLFTITYLPDNPGDNLGISYVMTTDTGGAATSSHVGIQAVAVAVPEPTSAITLLGGLAFVLSRRRRA